MVSDLTAEAVDAMYGGDPDSIAGDVECPECGRPWNSGRAAYLCSTQDTEEPDRDEWEPEWEPEDDEDSDEW